MTNKQLRSKTLNWQKRCLLGTLTTLASLTEWMERWEEGGGGRYHDIYHELRMLRINLDNFVQRFRETIK